MTIRGHFNGRVIVPDEPLDLPEGQALEVDVSVVDNSVRVSDAEWDRAFERLRARAIPGLRIPDNALSREHLYEDGA